MDRDRLRAHYSEKLEWLRRISTQQLREVLLGTRNTFSKTYRQLSPPKEPEVRVKEFSKVIGKLGRRGDSWEEDEVFVVDSNGTARAIVNDLIAGRLVCSTPDDVNRVKEILERSHVVQVVSSEMKHEATGYRACHIDIRIQVLDDLQSIWFPAEVQVKTLLQDAWSNFGHDEFYKPEAGVPEISVEISRRLADVLDALDWIGQAIRDERLKKRSGPMSISEDETLVTPRTLRYLVKDKFDDALSDMETSQCIDQLKAFGYDNYAAVAALIDDPEVKRVVENAKAAAGIAGRITTFEIIFFGPVAAKEGPESCAQELLGYYGYTDKKCSQCGDGIRKEQEEFVREKTDLDDTYLCAGCCNQVLHPCIECSKLTQSEVCKDCKAAQEENALV